ncbi:hypothetical protein [Croceicoccus bisphenolivorans]|uniref:hypothetical protein n=1 Tax=Croceicoccus bisphenolivorans TaxID=1783232 RepID=UPI00082C32F6|nr:hypothetical protein [Croceicoccus bisphenolivorans]
MQAIPPSSEPGTGDLRSAGKVGSIRKLAAAVLIAFALGAALAFYLAWSSGWLSNEDRATAQNEAVTAAALPGDAEQRAETPVAGGAMMPSQDTMATRINELERRLNRLDLQAEAASGHAARAEGLLVAFAARRLLERGAPLGYLENQLQLRFGNAQPNAVRTIINGSRNPVTLDSLRTGLENLSAVAVSEPETLSAWERVKTEISRLFVLRSASAPSPQPEIRLDRARLLLDDGRVEAAAALVERMPNKEGVEPWLADARRYIAMHDALDLIETAALLEPRQLIDGEGQPVRQGSPAAPVATPSPDAEAAAAVAD